MSEPENHQRSTESLSDYAARLQPKPKRAQEWTAEWLANFGNANNWLESICAAHNADLAAAVDEFTRYHHNPIVAQLNKKLATERETSDKIAENARNLHVENVRLAQQLVAEQKKKSSLVGYHENMREIAQLRSQLANERSKLAIAAQICAAKDDQLAAEREQVQALNDIMRLDNQNLNELRSQIAALADALKDMFAMIEEGLLVRDISKDGQPDYAIRMLRFTQRLAKANTALAKEGK